MLNWLLRSKSSPTSGKAIPDYKTARHIAGKGKDKERATLAGIHGLYPEILYLFATDSSKQVRLAVACNKSTPLQADKILAGDESEDVRYELAEKLSRMLPGLNEQESHDVAQMVMEIVSFLAEDQSKRVRQIIARRIRRLDFIPPKLALALARDAEAGVCGPVLEYSPLLNERQLLEIVKSGINGGALKALARRRNLPGSVAEAIVQTRLLQPVIALLRNVSAKIGKNAWVDLIDMAKNDTDICSVLIDRHDITLSTIRRISSFAGHAILRRVLEKHKANKEMCELVENVLKKNVRTAIEEGAADNIELLGQDEGIRASKLHEEGKLTSALLNDAVTNVDRLFLIHAISLLSDYPWESVRTIFNGKSGKPLAAIMWKSGLDASLCERIQLRIMHLTGKNVVRATPQKTYPMNEDEMEWQLGFIE